MRRNKLFFGALILAAAFSISACNLLPSAHRKSSDDVDDVSEIVMPEAYKIYELYVASGGNLTYEEWLESVRGEKGDPGHSPVVTIGNNGNWFIDGKDTGIQAQGEQGNPGDKGDTGKSAYEQYIEAHPEYTKSEEEWLDDLINGRLAAQQTHTVSFNTGEGSAVASQTVLHGEKATKPADPTRVGYTFEGWYYNGEPWSFYGFVVTGDMVIVAKWKAIDYVATFYNDDGTILDQQDNVHYGEQLTYQGETPVKPNPEDHYIYTFTGWDKELTVDGDMVFIAQYSKEYAPYEERYLDTEGNVIYQRFFATDNSRKITFNNKEVAPIDGQYYLEAEDAILSDGISVLRDSGHGNGAIGSPNVGRYLKYQITVSESISATITAAVSNTYNRFNELFSLKINGEEMVISDDAQHPGTWMWEDYQEGIVGKASFKEGLNEIIVDFKYDYFNMDYIGLKDCALDLSQEGVSIPTKASDSEFKYCFHDWEKQSEADDLVTYVPSFEKATKGLEFNNYSVETYHGTATNVIIPSWWEGYTITNIARQSFARTDVETVTLPGTITIIDERAFNYCEHLTSINLPSSIAKICGAAFEGCTSLENASFNEGLVEIDYYAFHSTKLKEIIIPSTVTLIQNDAFTYVQADFVYIPATCREIQSYAFGTTDERTMTVYCEREYRPSTYSADWARNNAVVWGYKSVVEENGFKYAISEIEGSTHATIVSIDETVKNFVAPETINGIPVSEISATLFMNNQHIETVTLPSFVTTIPEKMFYKAANLKTVSIPDSVTKIGRYAFADCSRLESIVMPDTVTEAGDHCFENCLNLASVTLSSGLKVIEEGLFKNCDSLTHIEIPEGVETTEFGIVESADNVRSITFPSTLKSLGNQTFFYNWGIDYFYLKCSPETWNTILETYNNDYDGIDRPTVLYYSETSPSEAGNYWHYVDGVPTEW